MPLPRVSVVVPAYNAAASLPATLDSILSQSLSEFEIIVVDDGSTDATRKIAESYAARDERVRVVSKPNGGTASAYNEGVRTARADLVAMLSADDTLDPGHLMAVVTAADEHPECAIFHTNGVFVYPDREYVGYRDTAHQSGHEVTFESLIRRCIYGVGAAYRREVWERIGGYAESTYAEDWDFWLRAARAGYRIWYVPVVSWRLTRSGSEKSGNLERMMESNVAVLERLATGGSLGDHLDEVLASEIVRHELRRERVSQGLPPDEPKAPKSPQRKVGLPRRLARAIRRRIAPGSGR